METKQPSPQWRRSTLRGAVCKLQPAAQAGDCESFRLQTCESHTHQKHPLNREKWNFLSKLQFFSKNWRRDSKGCGAWGSRCHSLRGIFLLTSAGHTRAAPLLAEALPFIPVAIHSPQTETREHVRS